MQHRNYIRQHENPFYLFIESTRMPRVPWYCIELFRTFSPSSRRTISIQNILNTILVISISWLVEPVRRRKSLNSEAEISAPYLDYFPLSIHPSLPPLVNRRVFTRQVLLQVFPFRKICSARKPRVALSTSGRDAEVHIDPSAPRLPPSGGIRQLARSLFLVVALSIWRFAPRRRRE